VSPVSREESDAYQAFKLVVGNLRSPSRMLNQIRDKALPEDTKHLTRRLVKGTPEIMQVIYHEALQKPTQLALYTQSEQSPNPESRVTLDRSRGDALGMPRINLHWRLTRIDKESIIRAQEIIGAQLDRSGLGRLVPEPAFQDDSDDWGPGLRGGHHHLGTARMSTDPKTGVVDPHGQAHTVSDLYIADSSVFPVGGYANPLLTGVAWSLRLADTIAGRY
jgi:choline dehydrogenase-like flavoprotein